MNTVRELDIDSWMKRCTSRIDIWVEFVNLHNIESMVEIGVYKGDFAERILCEGATIKTYHMVDSWRNLEGWNKPANTSN